MKSRQGPPCCSGEGEGGGEFIPDHWPEDSVHEWEIFLYRANIKVIFKPRNDLKSKKIALEAKNFNFQIVLP